MAPYIITDQNNNPIGVADHLTLEAMMSGSYYSNNEEAEKIRKSLDEKKSRKQLINLRRIVAEVRSSEYVHFE